jgi:hypothetical protein
MGDSPHRSGVPPRGVSPDNCEYSTSASLQADSPSHAAPDSCDVIDCLPVFFDGAENMVKETPLPKGPHLMLPLIDCGCRAKLDRLQDIGDG